MTSAEEENQPLRTNTGVRMNKHIKTVLITIFHIFKIGGDIEDVKKT